MPIISLISVQAMVECECGEEIEVCGECASGECPTCEQPYNVSFTYHDSEE